PPARSSSADCVPASSSARSLSPAISFAVSSSDRGASATVAAFTLPPPHAGRRSSNSSRAVQRISIGTSRTQSARCSMKSSTPSSAQWMSSNISTSGCCSASASKKRRHAAYASQGDELRRALTTRTLECADELLELTLAADQRCLHVWGQVDAEARTRLCDLPDRNRLFLPLRFDRRVLAVVDRLRGRAIRR